MNEMEKYGKETLDYHVALYQNVAQKIEYEVIKHDEYEFQVCYQTYITTYKRRDDLAEKLNERFPGNDYAVISTTGIDYVTWDLHMRNNGAERGWMIRFDWDRKTLKVMPRMVVGKKEHILYIGDCLKFLLNELKELPAYRLYFVTGSVNEDIGKMN